MTRCLTAARSPFSAARKKRLEIGSAYWFVAAFACASFLRDEMISTGLHFEIFERLDRCRCFLAQAANETIQSR